MELLIRKDKGKLPSLKEVKKTSEEFEKIVKKIIVIVEAQETCRLNGVSIEKN